MVKEKYSAVKIILFSCIPAIMLFLSLEIGCRVYFTIKYHKPHFLTYGFAGGQGALAKKEKIVVYDKVKHQIVHLPGDVVYYKSVPGVYDQHYGYRDFKININSLGFRGNEFSAVKPKGVYRIFCLGGSTTEGLEVEDGKDYPSVLQQSLNSSGLPMKAEVVNAGYMSSSSEILFNLLSNDIIKYRPDMVTFYEAFNDYHSIDDISPVAKMFKAIPQVLNFLYNKSLLFAIVLEKRCLYSKRAYDKSVMKRLLSDYSRNVRKIVEFAKNNGVKIILAKQGTYIKGYDMSFNVALVKSIAQRIEAGLPIAREEAYYYLHSATRDILDEIGKDMSVKVVDVHGELTKFPPNDVFYDTAHLTESGNRVIAGALSNEIKNCIMNAAAENK